MSGKKQGNDGVIGCLAFALLALGLMPFIGVYLFFKKDATDGERFLGFTLFIIGLILWFFVAAHS